MGPGGQTALVRDLYPPLLCLLKEDNDHTTGTNFSRERLPREGRRKKTEDEAGTRKR